MESKVTRITPAGDGWELEILEQYFEPAEQKVDVWRTVYRIIGWACVEYPQRDESVEYTVEPLICHCEWGIITPTELRNLDRSATQHLDWEDRVLFNGARPYVHTGSTRPLSDDDVVALGRAAAGALQRGKAKGFQVTNEEIAKRSGLPIERIAALRKNPASLNEGVR